jgi:hypothetical protein
MHVGRGTGVRHVPGWPASDEGRSVVPPIHIGRPHQALRSPDFADIERGARASLARPTFRRAP